MIAVRRWTGISILAAVATLGLAACNSAPADSASGTAKAPDAGTVDQTAASTGARRLNPGLWETISNVNGHALPPARSCIGEAEAGEINGDDASVRKGLARSNAAPGCEVKNVKIAGATVTFDTLCDGQSVHTAITYSGDSYAGEMTMNGKRTMALTARRIGTCPGQP